MYKCSRCGWETEELPTRTIYSSELGHCFSREETDDMCACGGDILKREQCECCGKWFWEYEMKYGYCEKCFEEEC